MTVRLVAEDVWQVYGVPSHAINAYIAGGTLIDAMTRWAGRLVIEAVRRHPVTSVALTHCHPDHQGSAATVCDALGIPLACHQADVGWTEGSLPVAFRSRMVNRIQYAWAGPPHRVDRVLRDGDMVGNFRVVHSPGHTLGHVIYFRESDRLAIAGDIVSNLNPYTRRVRLAEPPEMYSTDPEQNRRSLRTLIQLDPAVVCFGHGPPLREPAKLEEFARQLGV
ncbi:MAG TPA: MBL fold metallo-hydrolase [Candidatus Dormibacteraeota bacterium]|nr:MBL fold metallo-hydrolase [Candidatus Dormibacteraeota bacterium]